MTPGSEKGKWIHRFFPAFLLAFCSWLADSFKIQTTVCLVCLVHSDDVAVTYIGAHVHRAAVDQLHAAVCAVVHQDLLSLHAALGTAAQLFCCRLHSPGR